MEMRKDNRFTLSNKKTHTIMKYRHIITKASLAATFMAAMTVSCTGDLDVTPIDPSSTMVVDEPALYTKCYANMALAGNYGANGDCDIDAPPASSARCGTPTN